MNFGNIVAEIQQKYERERGKSGREKILNFGNGVTEILAAQIPYPSVSCARSVSAPKKKKKKKKKLIVAMSLPK